jgi:hypothetical protein
MPRSINRRRLTHFLAWCQAMRRYGRVPLSCTLLTLITAAGGCQRGPTWNLAPVEGTVLKDGRPLRDIEVVFLPDAGTQGPRSSGLTDESGHYRLRTDHGEDGAIVGSYRVCLHDTNRAPFSLSRLPKGAANAEHMQKKLAHLRKTASTSPRMPSCYGKPNETPLRAEIRPGQQVIDLEVK